MHLSAQPAFATDKTADSGSDDSGEGSTLEAPTMRLLRGCLSVGAANGGSDMSFRSSGDEQTLAASTLTDEPDIREIVHSMDDVGAVLLAQPKVSEAPSQLSVACAAPSWSSYYSSALAKHTLKGCL